MRAHHLELRGGSGRPRPQHRRPLRSPPAGRVPRIMVTLPSEAADDYDLVRRLVLSGMDVARVNGAHDDAPAWVQMAGNVRKASAEVGRPCPVSMDLPGPKLRTAGLVAGPRVVRLRPGRDQRGVAVSPALTTLVADTGTEGVAGALPVDASWIERRRPGDVVHMADTRGSRRELRVVERAPGTLVVEVWDTTYVETGALLSCRGDSTRRRCTGAGSPVPRPARGGPAAADEGPGAGHTLAKGPARGGPDRLHPGRSLRERPGRRAGGPRRREDQRDRRQRRSRGDPCPCRGRVASGIAAPGREGHQPAGHRPEPGCRDRCRSAPSPWPPLMPT